MCRLFICQQSQAKTIGKILTKLRPKIELDSRNTPANIQRCEGLLTEDFKHVYLCVCRPSVHLLVMPEKKAITALVGK